MPTTKFSKQTSTIGRGKTESTPIYTLGGRVRFLSLPVDANGVVTLTGFTFSVEGSFDGGGWFSVCDYNGTPIKITARALQKVLPGNGLAVHPAVLPVRDGFYAEGIQFVRLVGNKPEVEDQTIDVYFDAGHI